MIGEVVSAREYADLLSKGQSLENRQLSIDESLFRASYNRHPFEISHRLHEHDRFSLPSLFGLIRRLPESFVVCRLGLVPDEADFDSSFRPDGALDLEDALENLESCRAYDYARSPEAYPAFRPVIRDLIAEIAAPTATRDAAESEEVRPAPRLGRASSVHRAAPGAYRERVVRVSGGDVPDTPFRYVDQGTPDEPSSSSAGATSEAGRCRRVAGRTQGECVDRRGANAGSVSGPEDPALNATCEAPWRQGGRAATL